MYRQQIKEKENLKFIKPTSMMKVTCYDEMLKTGTGLPRKFNV